jgi:predicted MFS family arabinose efflux permease
VLVFAGFVVAIISTLGTPMIPTIADAQGVSVDTAQWLLTVTLLVGAVATPINGRLADGPWRRHAMLVSLGLVFIGAVISAIADSFGPFIAGRAMQGIGQAIIPLTIAAAREVLPKERVRGSIGILAITTAAGVGLGYPITGFIAQHYDYHAGFWFAAIVTALAIVAVYAVVPNTISDEARPLDIPGAVLLSVGLLALLLPISQGERWGWGSGRVLGLLAVAVIALALWVVQELRSSHPLVELRLLRHRNVMAANVIVVLMGMGLYSMSSLVNRYVQTPSEAGYGLHSSLLTTGLMLTPLSIGSVISSRLAARLVTRIGPGITLALGSAITGGDMLYMAITRSYRWEIVLATFLLGIGVGMTFAIMPALIIRSVPAHETGSATGLNQVLRLVGGAIGSAASVAILTAHQPDGAPFTTDHGYTVAFATGAVLCFLAAIGSLLMIGGAGRSSSPASAERGPKAARELASALSSGGRQ